jgi:hypothetical protein
MQIMHLVCISYYPEKHGHKAMPELQKQCSKVMPIGFADVN